MKFRKPPVRGALRVLLISAALLPLLALGGVRVLAAGQTTLDALEADIPTSPALQADDLAIQAAADDVRETRDKSGLTYTYSNSFGPEAVIVPYNVDDHVLRFEQAVGVKLPILGTRVAQQLAILDSERREQIAVVALNTAYRERLADLRDAYVRYWTDLRQADSAQTYLSGADEERPQARALVRNGFWTQTQYLDYLNTIDLVRAQQNEDRDTASADLAHISSALGRSVDRFEPAHPTFFANCITDRAAAVASAEAVDTTLADLEAERIEVGMELARVHGSSIDASLQARAGSQTDVNHRVSGYDVQVGVDAALPTHARDEERARRAKYTTELNEIALAERQRKAELAASVDADLAEISTDSQTLLQTSALERTRKQDVDTALARLNTIKQEPQLSFTDVHSKFDDYYESRRATTSAQSDLLLKQNDLLKIAPGVCGSGYRVIPPFAPQIKAASPKNTAGSPSPQTH